jgi:hypothetical protein
LHVLLYRTNFGRYRGRRVLISCFAILDSFSTVTMAPGPVFLFCSPRLVFNGTASRLFFIFCTPRFFLGGTEGVESRFHLLRSQTHFRRNRERRVPFSCFALPDSFSRVLRASGLVFMFCAPGLVLDCSEYVGSRWLILHSRTHLWRYRGRRVPSSCFALSDSFWAAPRASGPVFMFCALILTFDITKGAGSRFHVLRSRTRFGWHRVPFSCFVLPDSFGAVPRASGHVFKFCAPEIILCSTEGTGPRFHVLCSQNRLRTSQGRRSHFQVLRSRTRFWRYRWRRVPFSCFAFQDSF